MAVTAILFWNGSIHPKDFTGKIEIIPVNVRRAVLRCLQKGQPCAVYGEPYRCLICGSRLGNHDLTDGEFLWPEQAGHYLEAHGIWTPDCSMFVRSLVKKFQQKKTPPVESKKPMGRIETCRYAAIETFGQISRVLQQLSLASQEMIPVVLDRSGTEVPVGVLIRYREGKPVLVLLAQDEVHNAPPRKGGMER
jgi:hypothetical protein